MHARSCWLGQFGTQSKTKFTCEKALWIGDMFVELVLKDGVKLAATGAKTHLFRGISRQHEQKERHVYENTAFDSQAK